KREGDDIYIEKEISFSEACLGTTVEVPTLDGPKRVRIPPGTSPHTKLRLKGLGIPHLKGGGRGDAFLKVLVRVPKELTLEQRRVLEELAKVGL
ncbi:MAG: J domain-containing protein, partial [Deltaproteobacteria bacterium]